MSASDPSAPGLPLAGGGGAGLPTAAGADEVPVSTGAGTTYTATPLTAAVGDTLADLYGALDAGDFYVSDGAGVVPASSVAATVRAEIGVAAIPTAGVDASRPAASVATLGALYTATDTGVRYLCESDGAGGARWAVVGARGTEGRDTTSVLLDGSRGDTSATIVGSTVASFALVFAMRSSPGAVSVLLTVNPNTGTQGMQLDIGRDATDRYLLGMFRYGFGTTQVYLTGATITASPTTLHCIAVTLSGATVRYSLDGAAVATVSNGTGAADVGTAALRLGQSGAGLAPADAWLTSVALWSTAVGDSDLVAVSGSARAAGATPGRIPAVSGATEIVRDHLGWKRRPLLTEPLLAGSLGGSMTWSAAPVLVIR